MQNRGGVGNKAVRIAKQLVLQHTKIIQFANQQIKWTTFYHQVPTYAPQMTFKRVLLSTHTSAQVNCLFRKYCLETVLKQANWPCILLTSFWFNICFNRFFTEWHFWDYFLILFSICTSCATTRAKVAQLCKFSV